MAPILSKPSVVIVDKELSGRFMKACESVLLKPTKQFSNDPITLVALLAKEKNT